MQSACNKEKKSEALKKICKRPPTALTQNSIPKLSSKNYNPIKVTSNNQASKTINNFLNNPVLKKSDVEKKIEKKISLLSNSNTNNNINNKKNKINAKSSSQELSDKKEILNPIKNFINSKLNNLNLNNPRIIKKSFDLSIPSNSTINSTKSKTNSNKFSKSINSTPVNGFNGNNVIFFYILLFTNLETIIKHILYRSKNI